MTTSAPIAARAALQHLCELLRVLLAGVLVQPAVATTDLRDGTGIPAGAPTSFPLLWVSRRVVLGILLVGLTSLVSPQVPATQRWTVWPISGRVREPAEGGGAGHGAWRFRARGGDLLDSLPSPLRRSAAPSRTRRRPRRKLVALSFDDGPNEPYTSRLLDTLDKYNVKATFFQVGRCATTLPVLTSGWCRAATCWATTATVTHSPAISSSRARRSRSTSPRRCSIRSPA